MEGLVRRGRREEGQTVRDEREHLLPNCVGPLDMHNEREGAGEGGGEEEGLGGKGEGGGGAGWGVGAGWRYSFCTMHIIDAPHRCSKLVS